MNEAVSGSPPSLLKTVFSERLMALVLETRSVSEGVRYPEKRWTSSLTQRVTFLKQVPLG